MSLEPDHYDLLVVGGGINGVGIARDAAGQGLRVCLIEQSDLASCTSSASTKLIHGGLRYLEYREFRLVRESLTERERLLGIAPHLIHPVRFLFPYTPGLRPRWQIRLGLFVYDHVGGRKRLPSSAPIRFARAACGSPLRGDIVHGFAYSDCSVDDSRLVVLNALDAATRGAAIVTRLQLHSAQPQAHGLLAKCLDLNTGQIRRIRARALINAAGAWVNAVRDSVGLRGQDPLRLIQGSHIVVPRLFAGDEAYILQNPDRRIVFVIPYEQHYTLIGTTDVPFEGDPRQVRITADEIAYLCESVNRYFRRPITPEEILWSYAGVRTLRDDKAAAAAAVTRDYELKLERLPGGAPVLSIIGGKLTTYRKLAEAALSRVLPLLGRTSHSWTAGTALPGGDLPGGDFTKFLAQVRVRWPFLSASTALRLARAYGTRIAMILGEADGFEALGGTFGDELSRAEVCYLRQHEWAVTCEDLLWRRTKLGLRLSAAESQRLADYLHESDFTAFARGSA